MGYLHDCYCGALNLASLEQEAAKCYLSGQANEKLCCLQPRCSGAGTDAGTITSKSRGYLGKFSHYKSDQASKRFLKILGKKLSWD